MKIVELIIDEDDMYSGIDAISLVDSPAIEENFVALNKQKKYSFKTVNNEKRILMGALLVPNKTIYRKDGDEEYYIYFSKATIKKASEMYLMNGKQNNSTSDIFSVLSAKYPSILNPRTFPVLTYSFQTSSLLTLTAPTQVPTGTSKPYKADLSLSLSSTIQDSTKLSPDNSY